MIIKLKEPTKKDVMDAVNEINKEGSDFKIHNDTLNRLFKEYNKNDDFEKVLIKVVALNTFYSAGVKNIHITNMANHIVSVYNQKKYKDNPCLIVNDSLNNNHCVELVKELASLEVDVKKDERIISKVVHYNSFASKFCFFQNNNFFFIMDSYVIELLFEFKKQFKDKY